MSYCKGIWLLCELICAERNTAWQRRDYTEGLAFVAGLRVEMGMEMPPVGNTVQKETANSPFAAGTWSCLPPIYEGTERNPHLCLTHGIRTSARLNLTKHPLPRGQTGPGQWKEANNSNISAWGLSPGALDKRPDVHIENWNTSDTSLWNGVTSGSLTGMWNHTE